MRTAFIFSHLLLCAGNRTGRDCNPLSTGTIILADILPAIAVKLVAPFIHIPVSVKVPSGPRVNLDTEADQHSLHADPDLAFSVHSNWSGFRNRTALLIKKGKPCFVYNYLPYPTKRCSIYHLDRIQIKQLKWMRICADPVLQPFVTKPVLKTTYCFLFIWRLFRTFVFFHRQRFFVFIICFEDVHLSGSEETWCSRAKTLTIILNSQHA